jgi:hypothetical protein
MKKVLFLFTMIALAVPRVALACPVCFGQNDSPMAIATNLGIMAMLVVVAGMLASFAAFFIYLSRRAKLVAANNLGATSSDGTLMHGTDPQEGTAQC